MFRIATAIAIFMVTALSPVGAAEPIDRDESCERTAPILLGDGLGQLVAASVTGCVLSDGLWVWQESSPPVTGLAASSYRTHLRAQLRIVEAALREGDYWEYLEAIASYGECSFRWGVGDRMLDPIELDVYKEYAGTLLYLAADEQVSTEFREYVGWWMGYRMLYLSGEIGREAHESGIEPEGTSYVHRMGFHRIPWHWELANPATIERFIQWQVDTGAVQ